MKNLTFRYSLTQFFFWASSTGASGFATTYLLRRGLFSSTVGAMLAIAGILSCLFQPVLGEITNRNRSFPLAYILAFLSLGCAICFSVPILPGIPNIGVGLCYVCGIFLSNLMLPFLNSLYISYEQAGFSIRYSIARGIGSAASALSALFLGHGMAKFGNNWMLLILIAFRLLSVVLFLGYPPLSAEQISDSHRQFYNCTVVAFPTRYPWYCATLLGVLFLGMYHAMTENYMIAIMDRLGGSSSHVGTALFLASMVGAPVIFCFRLIRKRLPDTKLLKISACTFLLKSVLLCFAKSIPTIYGIQLLQMTSYAFLEPTLVYYSRDSVGTSDLLIGQSFSTGAYALGCSAGNFVGGLLLPHGVSLILVAGVCMAAVGTVLILTTVQMRDHML